MKLTRKVPAAPVTISPGSNEHCVSTGDTYPALPPRKRRTGEVFGTTPSKADGVWMEKSFDKQ